MNTKKEGLIVSLLLLVAGYLVGAMFCGWNSRDWSNGASGAYGTWFFIVVIIGLAVAYGREDKK